jgi:uncharacterized protein YkwD
MSIGRVRGGVAARTFVARVVIALALTVAVVAPASQVVHALVPTSALTVADTGAESAFLAATNQRRAAAGVAPLSIDSRLVGPARQWSQEMANDGQISHRSNSRLKSEAPPEWTVIGENVGTGPEVSLIQTAFENSPPHLRNIVDRRFTHVGFGVIAQADTLWVAAYFMAYSSAPAPEPAPEPAPVAEPAPTTAPRATTPRTTTAPATTAAPPVETTTTALPAPLPRLANFNPTVTRPIRVPVRRGGPRAEFLSLHGIGV